MALDKTNHECDICKDSLIIVYEDRDDIWSINADTIYDNYCTLYCNNCHVYYYTCASCSDDYEDYLEHVPDKLCPSEKRELFLESNRHLPPSMKVHFCKFSEAVDFSNMSHLN